MSPILVISIIVFFAILAILVFNRIIKLITSDDVPKVRTVPTNVPKVPIVPKSDREAANEKRNFQKAQLKACRQGHFQFCFHDQYYRTGLTKLDGTGK